MAEVTGRDGRIITEALAFGYAAMRYLPRLYRPESNSDDMRALLFARLGSERAEFALGEAILMAWHLTHDIPAAAPTSEFRDNVRRIREQVVQEPPDPDIPVLVRHIDRFLASGTLASLQLACARPANSLGLGQQPTCASDLERWTHFA